MKQLRCDSIGWVRVSPSKGSGSFVVGFDVAHELAAQVGNGFEDSAGITWRWTLENQFSTWLSQEL